MHTHFEPKRKRTAVRHEPLRWTAVKDSAVKDSSMSHPIPHHQQCCTCTTTTAADSAATTSNDAAADNTRNKVMCYDGFACDFAVLLNLLATGTQLSRTVSFGGA